MTDESTEVLAAEGQDSVKEHELVVEGRSEDAGAQSSDAAEAQSSEEEIDGVPENAGPNTPEGIRAGVVEAIKGVYDPEIPVNVWDLGLIYGVDVGSDRKVDIKMTLTSPMCPTAQSLVFQVEMAAKETAYVQDAEVELVWEPPWDMDKMSEEARLMLGF